MNGDTESLRSRLRRETFRPCDRDRRRSSTPCCVPHFSPVKYAAHLLGKTAPGCRLPIAPLSVQGQETVRGAMVKAGLIN